MDNQLIEKLYEIIIKELTLTYDILINNDITKDNIQYLLDNQIIKETSLNNYELIDINSLHRYGIKLLFKKQYRLANDCFIKCYKLNPNDKEICLQLALAALKRGSYNETYKMISELEKIDKENNQKDIILYIYLLSLITKPKEEYQDLLINLTEKDLLFEEPHKENIIREQIIKGKYKHAMNMLNDQISIDIKYNPKNIFIKELLSQVINREQKFKQVLYYNIKDKNYSLVLEYLKNKSYVLSKEKQETIINSEDILKYLSQQEVRIYLVTKKLIEIKETGIIPKIKNQYSNNINEAINNNNFKYARTINNSFLKRLNINPETDLLYLLLEDINNIIMNIKKEELLNLKEELTSHIEDSKIYTKKI